MRKVRPAHRPVPRSQEAQGGSPPRRTKVGHLCGRRFPIRAEGARGIDALFDYGEDHCHCNHPMGHNAREELQRIALDIKAKTEPAVLKKELIPLGIADEQIVLQNIARRSETVMYLVETITRTVGQLPTKQRRKLQNPSRKLMKNRADQLIMEYMDPIRHVFENKLCSASTFTSISILIAHIAGFRMAAEDVLMELKQGMAGGEG